MLSLADLVTSLSLGELLARLVAHEGGYELVAHWKQGEFHHDVVVRPTSAQPAAVLVVATNCNGGVKEVLAFADVPDRSALWHWRCPTSPDFVGTLTPLAQARTLHYFDPCELLADDARSELLPEHRRRQSGGGWCALDDED